MGQCSGGEHGKEQRIEGLSPRDRTEASTAIAAFPVWDCTKNSAQWPSAKLGLSPTACDLGWTLATLDRTQCEVLHLTTSVLFTAVVLWHLALHAATLKNLIWGATSYSLRHGTELPAAALAFLVIVALVLADRPAELAAAAGRLHEARILVIAGLARLRQIRAEGAGRL